MKNIVNEIKLMHSVNFHANIIQFFGITSNTSITSGLGSNYLFILEYADSVQIADAVSCIHQKDIIHYDLHSDNILVHKNAIKLADFGLSRKAGVSNSAKDVMGKVPYIDPQRLKHLGPQRLKHQTNNNDKKSDVYSVGVLLWEISSGRKPFESCDTFHAEVALICHILEGNREVPIVGTPDNYISIYTRCWRDNPDDRPDMHQVFSDLVSLSMNENTLLAEGSTDTGENIIEQKINNSLSRQTYDQSSYNSQIIMNYVPSQEVTNGNDLKIIMTGIEELKDLDVNNTKHYKQINIKPSLEDENYEVFGSVILKNNLRLEDILISFKLHVYDFNGFSVIIKPLNNADIDITKCYLLWMIIGSSPKLSAFSPRNRELQVYCIKESIALKPTNSYYSIKTSCQLFQGYTISVNVYCPTANHKLINLKINIVGWSEYCIYFRIAKSNYNNLNSDNSSDSTESHDGDTDFLTNVEITICILSSNYKNLSIDNMEGKEYSLASIGHCLTENTKIIPSINVNELGSEHLQEMEAGIKKNDVVLYPLKLTDYERDDKEKPRKNGHVTKWVSLKNKNEEFAFKIISEEEINDIQNQIVILKELHDWQNITRIYGLICEGKDWFWVSEWAKYGNLREYYTNYKDRFDVRLKLRMSLDIARGLNFLRTVEILHHDIRAENILITLHETAKLANFKSCHSLFTTTLNQNQNLERVRYCAPELLEMAHNFKYDYNCEIYSFGILLWEIAEERTPYEQYNDIVKITDLVRNQKYREPFSKDSQIPLSFTSLALKAVDHDPKFRSEISKMFEVLNNCFEESKTQVISTTIQSDVFKEIVPISKFHPLINEIRSILNEIIELAQAAEHNSQICEVLKRRVYAVDSATFELSVSRKNHEFFNKKNYSSLQSLVSVITQIKRFISDISQMKNLIKLKYIQPQNIEKTFKELCREFDICIINIDSASFRDIINNRIHIEEEIKSLKSDQEDLSVS
ncbi:unnamed protein product [Rhizophagus irregularis]|nr:unnamed protein product [Rhizophagus irregularis]